MAGMLSTLFAAYIMCLRWEWASDSVMCSDGMCVAVGEHSGGSWKHAPSVCWSVEGSRCGAGGVPIAARAVTGEWFAGIWNKGWGSPGEECGKKPGENSAELSFPVDKIEYKQGQNVWRPAGRWTDGFLTSCGRAALCWMW